MDLQLVAVVLLASVRLLSVHVSIIIDRCLTVRAKPPEKIIHADVYTTCNVKALLADTKQSLAVLTIQSLAVNAAKIVHERVNVDFLRNALHDSLVVYFPSNSDLAGQTLRGVRAL